MPCRPRILIELEASEWFCWKHIRTFTAYVKNYTLDAVSARCICGRTQQMAVINARCNVDSCIAYNVDRAFRRDVHLNLLCSLEHLLGFFSGAHEIARLTHKYLLVGATVSVLLPVHPFSPPSSRSFSYIRPSLLFSQNQAVKQIIPFFFVFIFY